MGRVQNSHTALMRAMELEELPKEIPMANLSAVPLVSELILTVGCEKR